MKISNVLLVMALGFLVTAPSCKKDTTAQTNVASVIVVNADPLAGPIIPVFQEGPALYYANSRTLNYGKSFIYTNASGHVPFHVTSILDTTTNLYSTNFLLVLNGNYSFFLYPGNGKTDNGLLTRDSLPLLSLYDSSAGLRFVNLSPDSKTLSINLAGNLPTQTEFNLGFGQASPFKLYSTADSIGGSYPFEIRDQASGNLLTTYYWTYQKHFAHTLVLAGSVSDTSSTPLRVFLVKHY